MTQLISGNESRSNYFDRLEGNDQEFEFAKERLLQLVDYIASKLPTNLTFTNFKNSFEPIEADFGQIIEVDGGKYSIPEILKHIETRLDSDDSLSLKPNIETWIEALPKPI